MTEYRRVRGAGRGHLRLALFVWSGLCLLSACSDFKQMIGLDQPMPDEFAVEFARAADDPAGFRSAPAGAGGAAAAGKVARETGQQVMEQAGPGEPGKAGRRSSSARLRRRPPRHRRVQRAGARTSPAWSAPRACRTSCLTTGDTGTAGATVEKHETTPLKGVY